jgi:cell division transport system permease protein
LKTIRRRKSTRLGSYPTGSVVFSTTLALFLLGLFGWLLINTQELVSYIRENMEMQVYFNGNTRPEQAKKLQQDLLLKDYILKKEGEESIGFISKEDAAKDLIAQTGEDFISFLGDNPLKDALIIRIHPDFQDSTSLAEIKAEIEQMPHVFEVSYIESLVQAINKNKKRIGIALLSLSLILFITISTLINNTIRLALFSQRFLIRSMQLVGATEGFISKPFLLRAGGFGLLSAVIASTLLAALLYYAQGAIPEITLLHHTEKILILFGSLALLGLFIALISTWRAIKKYLKMSLDELY